MDKKSHFKKFKNQSMINNLNNKPLFVIYSTRRKKMDRSRYSNVSLSHATYEVLKKLSYKLLPGNTSLSLSKTVEALALEKMQQITNQNGEYKND